MQRVAVTAFSGLVVAVLIAGCGRDGSTALDATRSLGQASGPLLVGQSLPEWHPVLPEGHPPLNQGEPALPEGHQPVLPEGHPPISRGECPAGGMEGRGVFPGATGPERGTIST